MFDIALFWVFLIATSVLVWKYVFLDHELMHIMEHVRQGATTGGIEFKFYKKYIPTMRCWGNYTTDKYKVALAGGLYSGIQVLILGFFAWYSKILWLEIPCVIIGVTNLVYASYERLFLHEWTYDKYMRYHYVVYGVTIIGMIILYLLREL